MPTKRHRSFGTKRSLAKLEPLSFDLLDGKYEFECKPTLQGAVILDFISKAGDDNQATAATHLVEFVRRALLDEENVIKFNSVITSEDPEDTIEIEDIANIVAWLVEEYTARPTQAS